MSDGERLPRRPARPSPYAVDLTERFGRFRVVLVEPKYSGNLGQVARAMATAGFRRLELVRCRAEVDLDAIKWSMGGRPILEAARYHEAVDEALDGVQQVFVTTRFGGRHRPNPITPRQAARLALAATSESPEIESAIVFGAEDRGLSRADASHATSFLSIPTGGTASLNLAQAVAVVLHAFTDEALEPPVQGKLAAGERWRAARRLVALLERVDFVEDEDPARMATKILASFDRFDLDPRELKILHGMINQIEKHLRDES